MQYNRYSEQTIRLYVHQIQQFMDSFNTNPRLIGDADIQAYLESKTIADKCSRSAQNQMISALKMFYDKIVKKPIDDSVFVRPKKTNYLPTVLSKEEVKSIIDSINNLKHKAIISTIYSCGLRISELINLHIRDIDSKRMVIFIRDSKGNKDRIVPLSKKLLELLRKYWIQHKPVTFLFEGADSVRYSRESVSNILKRAVKFNKIEKHVTIHSLRHSYATHLMDAGVNLRLIQSILGHKNIKTTTIYTHVSNQNIQDVFSPLDDL
ncbi:MAG: tyrosine-type recombinase/integrase [Bacteroidales bacterium]|nr:tyrosine-type recombinase/integrase [Bacteroidales bacterium]